MASTAYIRANGNRKTANVGTWEHSTRLKRPSSITNVCCKCTFSSGLARCEVETTKPVVRGCHAEQQCLGLAERRVQTGQCAEDCAVSKAIRRTQPPPQRHAAPVGDVDAEFLHESRWKKPFTHGQSRSEARQGRIAKRVRQKIKQNPLNLQDWLRISKESLQEA